MSHPLIRTENICTFFPIKTGFFKKTTHYLKAVNEVNFELFEGEIVSVVGESGCGKSTLGNTLIGLTKATSGNLFLEGQRVDTSQLSSWKPYRKNFQLIFQDPFSSLNPRQTILEILSEPLLLHKICTRSKVKERAALLLEKVGLNRESLERYPHAFSGGQRQRIGIARALAVNPKVIICDEIVSALDVSVQAQVIQLLLELKRELNLSLVFIAHDLSLVRAISDRVYVMYLGKVMEAGDAKAIFKKASHPYTQALLDSVPTLNRNKKPIILEGEVPDAKENLSGCVFYNRCKNRQSKCAQTEPEISYIQGRNVACYFPNE